MRSPIFRPSSKIPLSLILCLPGGAKIHHLEECHIDPVPRDLASRRMPQPRERATCFAERRALSPFKPPQYNLSDLVLYEGAQYVKIQERLLEKLLNLYTHPEKRSCSVASVQMCTRVS